ncbi:dynein regulatory complex protein 9 [Poecilia latipinna]|uniref:Dynein regulatory complex protein 9 n=1 Tax=Poecilia mexicana TaxID=48701 RepID=A0A3B3XPQ1_9TELE|nr:PREDICTED: IQ domain-containing protein G [Poecilia formosa]XP_014853913.1 PREDICTED: IQ domain-containing protein G [Poecilia mexicana]XP_014912879.1 PREDICTED: IQ domain-containing protein G [Poecilia latipinna]
MRLTMSLYLSKIQSLRTVAALEDCAHQLDLLGHSLSVQISRERGSTSTQEKDRLVQLKADCQFICHHVTKLCFELEDTQSFESIPQAMEEDEAQKAARKKREEEKMRKEREQALLIQQQEIEDKKDQIHKMYLLLNELEGERSKLQKKKKSKTTILSTQMAKESWRKAQLMDQLELLQKQMEEEARFHEETVKFLQTQYEEFQQRLHKWKQQTKKMQQEKQSKLDNLGCKRTLNTDKLMEMRRMFKEMERVVLEDKKEQELKRQQEEEAKAATTIQAYWRGTMVRRGLGPFKKVEEKKGKKGKKGKKKK